MEGMFQFAVKNLSKGWNRVRIVCLLLVFMESSGCALLFPDRTAPKSGNYRVTNPPSPWSKLKPGEDIDAPEAFKADLAFENPKTGAIISLNSVCRKYQESSLDSLTESLVRGIDQRETLERKDLTLDGVAALNTVYLGFVDGVKLKIETVVLKKNFCTYDFIYVVIPEKEKESHFIFEQFIHSFKAD